MIRTISHKLNTDQGSVLLKAINYLSTNKIKYVCVWRGVSRPISKATYLRGIELYKEQNPMVLRGVPAPTLEDAPHA